MVAAVVPTHINAHLVLRALDALNPHLNVRRCLIIRVQRTLMRRDLSWRILASLACKYAGGANSMNLEKSNKKYWIFYYESLVYVCMSVCVVCVELSLNRVIFFFIIVVDHLDISSVNLSNVMDWWRRRNRDNGLDWVCCGLWAIVVFFLSTIM